MTKRILRSIEKNFNPKKVKIAFGSSGFRHRFPKKQELWFGHNDEDLGISTGMYFLSDIRNEPHAFFWPV